MNEFCLTRKQVMQLADIAKRFPEVQWYTLTEDNSNGIGPVVKVQFIMLPDSTRGDYDTTVDITDVETW